MFVPACASSVSGQTLVPAVDWMPYLTAVFAPVPLNESEPVVVYAKEYLEKVSDLIDKTNKRSDTLPFNADKGCVLLCLFILIYNYVVKLIKLKGQGKL